MLDPDEIRYIARFELQGRSTSGSHTDQLAHAAAIAGALQAIPDSIERSRHTVAVFGTEAEAVGTDDWLLIVAEDGYADND